MMRRIMRMCGIEIAMALLALLVLGATVTMVRAQEMNCVIYLGWQEPDLENFECVDADDDCVTCIAEITVYV